MANTLGGAFAGAVLGLMVAQAAAQPLKSADENSMPTPLTQTPGEPGRGLAIVRNAANASCLICHALPIAGEPDPGNIGPPLDGVGSRLSAGELRQRLVDPKKVNAATMMPAYFRSEGLYRVDAPYRNKTIYSAQEIEDVVAYLLTLKEK